MSSNRVVYPGMQNQQYMQQQHTAVQMDAANTMYNQHGDTEMLNLSMDPNSVGIKRRPFDWCILSVLGYLCCPAIGLCAMYYSARANHGVDWNLHQGHVDRHTKKAMILTITSITLGVIGIIAFIAIVVHMLNSVNNVENMINQRG